MVDDRQLSIELLWWEGCPSTVRMREILVGLLDDLDMPSVLITEREIETIDQAREERFVGSPTVRVNGMDVDHRNLDNAQPSLGCRLYTLRDGRFSPLPEIEDVREALLKGKK